MKGLSIFFTVLIAITLLYFISLPKAPKILASSLSKKLGVLVSIKSIKFGISDTKISSVEISNPQDYKLAKAFSSGEIEISSPITEFLKSEVKIDEVKVDDIYLGLEFDFKNSLNGNWTKILSNFQQNTNINKNTGKEVFVKKIIFTNIASEVMFRDSGDSQKLPIIDRIELQDISTKGGLPIDQLMGTILAQMLKQVFIKQNMNNMLKGIILDAPEKTIDSLMKPFKGFFNTLEKNSFEATA